jgi:hypothetical protein
MKEIYTIEVLREDLTLTVACNPGEIEIVATAIASGLAREVFYRKDGEIHNAWPECYDNNEPMNADYVYREA